MWRGVGLCSGNEGLNCGPGFLGKTLETGYADRLMRLRTDPPDGRNPATTGMAAKRHKRRKTGNAQVIFAVPSPKWDDCRKGTQRRHRQKLTQLVSLRSFVANSPWFLFLRAGTFAPFALFRGYAFVFSAQECQVRFLLPLFLAALALGGTGCGTFVAHRMVQAPNTYPTWFAPEPRRTLGFSPKMLTNFPARFLEVGPPAAKLRYRVIDPADYQLKVTSTNWVAHDRTHFEFTFNATVPAASNAWTAAPRGTVVLLHGYGISQFAMAPWAMCLGQAGWRCVLVDLRGQRKINRQKDLLWHSGNA